MKKYLIPTKRVLKPMTHLEIQHHIDLKTPFSFRYRWYQPKPAFVSSLLAMLCLGISSSVANATINNDDGDHQAVALFEEFQVAALASQNAKIDFQQLAQKTKELNATLERTREKLSANTISTSDLNHTQASLARDIRQQLAEEMETQRQAHAMASEASLQEITALREQLVGANYAVERQQEIINRLSAQVNYLHNVQASMEHQQQNLLHHLASTLDHVQYYERQLAENHALLNELRSNLAENEEQNAQLLDGLKLDLMRQSVENHTHATTIEEQHHDIANLQETIRIQKSAFQTEIRQHQLAKQAMQQKIQELVTTLNENQQQLLTIQEYVSYLQHINIQNQVAAANDKPEALDLTPLATALDYSLFLETAYHDSTARLNQLEQSLSEKHDTQHQLESQLHTSLADYNADRLMLETKIEEQRSQLISLQAAIHNLQNEFLTANQQHRDELHTLQSDKLTLAALLDEKEIQLKESEEKMHALEASHNILTQDNIASQFNPATNAMEAGDATEQRTTPLMVFSANQTNVQDNVQESVEDSDKPSPTNNLLSAFLSYEAIIADYEQKQKSIIERLAETESAHSLLETQLNHELANRPTDSEERINQLLAEQDTLLERLGTKEEQRYQLEAELRRVVAIFNAEKDEFEAEVVTHRNVIASLESQLDASETRNVNIDKQLDNPLNAKVQELALQLAEKDQLLITLQDLVEELQSANMQAAKISHKDIASSTASKESESERTLLATVLAYEAIIDEHQIQQTRLLDRLATKEELLNKLKSQLHDTLANHNAEIQELRAYLDTQQLQAYRSPQYQPAQMQTSYAPNHLDMPHSEQRVTHNIKANESPIDENQVALDNFYDMRQNDERLSQLELELEYQRANRYSQSEAFEIQLDNYHNEISYIKSQLKQNENPQYK